MEKIKTIYEYSFSTEKDRWKTWYIIVLSLIIWLVIWWFLTKQYWLSFIIMLFSWVYLLLENNVETSNINIKITELWIFINDNFYEYEKIPYFSIIYYDNKPIFLRLYFDSGMKFLNLDIKSEDVLEIKNILNNYIEEKNDDKLNFIDKIILNLKL